MGMQVLVRINGRTITTVNLKNEGPVDGKYEAGDHEGGHGRRVYSWTARDEEGRQMRGADIIHERKEGANFLAAQVLYRLAMDR